MSEINISFQTALTCKPLYKYEEIFTFLDNPPAWRKLTVELNQHSPLAIKNTEIQNSDFILYEKSPKTYCHFDSEKYFDVRRHERKQLSKTLVCHDMANGYHDDSFIDGTNNYDAYNFYNWGGIDIFCYFSHHFVTIPPLGWINVGHAHGVKVLGTIITEWEDGRAIWERILQSEKEWCDFASALVAIAKCMRFDGWLLNIENKISKPQELLKFVQYLSKWLHNEVPGSVLIWYDSVTIDGQLAWQNKLNEKNRAFFDATDGIFTNYSWSEADIESSVAAAGDRRYDLYIGVDVWGRNFYGGGKFNTNTAIEVIHKHNCSLAIFAPAWTYEAVPDNKDYPDSRTGAIDSLDKYEHYLLRERALWSSIWRFLNTKLPCRLPFKTSFCRGQGKKRNLYGETLTPQPWYNLRYMNYQPNTPQGPHGYTLIQRRDIHNLEEITLNKETQHNVSRLTDQSHAKDTSQRGSSKTASSKIDMNEIILIPIAKERECLQNYVEDAFNGGSCIKINPSDDVCTAYRTSRLFFCDFIYEEAMIACVVTKTLEEKEDQYLNVLLKIEESVGEDNIVELVGVDAWLPTTSLSSVTAVYPVVGSELKQLQEYMQSEEPDFYIPSDNKFGWNIRYYVFGKDGGRIVSVCCRTGLPDGGILLGHFGLCQKTFKDDSSTSYEDNQV